MSSFYGFKMSDEYGCWVIFPGGCYIRFEGYPPDCFPYEEDEDEQIKYYVFDNYGFLVPIYEE